MPDPVPPRTRPPDPCRRLLVLACSARKRKHSGLLPAIDRYDGAAFRVLRKYLTNADGPPDVLILSARYGLIPTDREIPDYDQKLTPDSAVALRPGVLLALGVALAGSRYAEVGLCLGRDYLRAVAGYEDVTPTGTAVKMIAGTQGGRLAEPAWLARRGSA